MRSTNVSEEEFADWVCGKCGCPLEFREVKVSYLGHGFPEPLPVCPKCGQVFIPEQLAIGKMQQIEQQMEDK